MRKLKLPRSYVIRKEIHKYEYATQSRVTRLPCPKATSLRPPFCVQMERKVSQVIMRLQTENSDTPEARQRFRKEIRENWILFHFPSCFKPSVKMTGHVHIIFLSFIFVEDQLKQTHLSFVDGNITDCLAIRMASLQPITRLCGNPEPRGWHTRATELRISYTFLKQIFCIKLPSFTAKKAVLHSHGNSHNVSKPVPQ